MLLGMTCFLVMGGFVGLIGGDNVVLRVSSGGVGGCTFDVLERPGGVRAHLPFAVVNRRLGEGQRFGSVFQKPFANQQASAWLHEAGLHLDGNNPHVLLHATCRSGHADIQQRHHCAAVRDVECIEMFGLGVIADLRVATVEHIQVKAQVFDEGNLDGEAHAARLRARNDAHATVYRKPLASDVLASVAGEKQGDTFQVFIIAQAIQRSG